jgi:hypothetical protein
VVGQVPAWAPELVALELEVRRSKRVLEVATERRNLALWYVAEAKGAGPTWVARCLGLSRMRVNDLTKAGREYAERKNLSFSDAAALLFTPMEKAEARREKIRAQRKALAIKLDWWSAPGPGGRPLPPPAERGWGPRTVAEHPTPGALDSASGEILVADGEGDANGVV